MVTSVIYFSYTILSYLVITCAHSHLMFIAISQVVHQQSSLLAPLAVDAVLKVTEEGKESSVDLHVRTNVSIYIFR